MTEINNAKPTKGRRAAAAIAGSALTLSSVAFGAPAAFAADNQQQTQETQTAHHEQSEVAGKLQITPSSTEVQAGDSFMVQGTGFAPNDDVQLRVGNEILANEHADANGEIAVEVDIPDDFEPGTHSLAAINYGGGNAAYADFEVLEKSDEPEVDPDVDIASDELAPGDELEASGEGFTPEGEVRFSVHKDDKTFERVVTADENGDVSNSMTIPEDTENGSYDLTVFDYESDEKASEQFTVEDADEA